MIYRMRNLSSFTFHVCFMLEIIDSRHFSFQAIERYWEDKWEHPEWAEETETAREDSIEASANGVSDSVNIRCSSFSFSSGIIQKQFLLLIAGQHSSTLWMHWDTLAGNHGKHTKYLTPPLNWNCLYWSSQWFCRRPNRPHKLIRVVINSIRIGIGPVTSSTDPI